MLKNMVGIFRVAREDMGFTFIDYTRFIVYAAFFSILLFMTQRAISPGLQTPLNSAMQKDEKPMQVQGEAIAFELGEKTQDTLPPLAIELKPQDIVVNSLLLKSLEFNTNTKAFFDKVTPLQVVIDKTRQDPRGQYAGTKLILSGNMKNVKEAVKVFVHELGHVVDIRYLEDYGDYDPSENFYTVSWVTYNVKKKDSKLADFVSGYALTNKYEDFAESFSFFVFHNEEFKRRASKNPALEKKYGFFKDFIFINNEFIRTSFETSKIQPYNWDSTKIPINLKKYLYYIK